MTVDELVREVCRDPMERLRWRVLRAFGILPCSAEAQGMTDEDCLRYAANMLADRAAPEELNPAFDTSRYLKLKEGQSR